MAFYSNCWETELSTIFHGGPPIRFFLNPEFFESLPIVYVSLPIATVVVVSPSCKFSPDTSIVCWLCILGTALCGLVWVLVWGCFSEAAEVAEVGRPPGQGEDMIFPTLSKFFTAPLFLALRPFFGLNFGLKKKGLYAIEALYQLVVRHKKRYYCLLWVLCYGAPNSARGLGLHSQLCERPSALLAAL